MFFFLKSLKSRIEFSYLQSEIVSHFFPWLVMVWLFWRLQLFCRVSLFGHVCCFLLVWLRLYIFVRNHRSITCVFSQCMTSVAPWLILYTFWSLTWGQTSLLCSHYFPFGINAFVWRHIKTIVISCSLSLFFYFIISEWAHSFYSMDYNLLLSFNAQIIPDWSLRLLLSWLMWRK